MSRGGGVDFCCLERRFLSDDFSGIESNGSASFSGVGGRISIRAEGGV